MHALQFESETDAHVRFVCSVCAEPIEFVKPSGGSPNPVLVDGVWEPPGNPDQWMGPCSQAPP